MELLQCDLRCGLFVRTVDHPFLLIIARLPVSILLLLPNGNIISDRMPKWTVIDPPVDPTVTFQRKTTVKVYRGRLRGMFGEVLGSVQSQVYVRANPHSTPALVQYVDVLEWYYFVVDAECLKKWEKKEMLPSSPLE
uniref:Uncharacterized protein n=1 Tax=Anopheles culicifacies TaxID=139723 RepID=A0A182LU58_9DIPT